MSPRRTVAALIFALATLAPSLISPAYAQNDDARLTPIAESIAPSAAAVRFVDDQAVAQMPRELRRSGTSWSTPVMAALHATTLATQMLDVHSTLRALDTGASEANPLMSGLVKNRAAFIGVKAAMGAGLMYATHKMAQRNRVAAIVTAVAVNSAMLTVAHHNYKIARFVR